MNGKVSATTTSTPKNAESIIIRRAHITEGYKIGQIAARTYYDTALTRFLSPHKSKYYSHYLRGFQHRAQVRLFNPRNVSFVACEATNPERPIGYAQFARLGDDEGAKRQIRSRNSLWLTILNWMFWAWTKLVNFVVGGDKSADLEALETFFRICDVDDKLHWEKPERLNRWEAQSVVVLEEYQGKGIGKRLMMEVIALAEAENVVVGLAASESGEMMYRSVGFELLARFQQVLEGEEGGGVMMYTPKGWKAGQSI